MRPKFIAGNWKMNGSLAANEALLKEILAGLPSPLKAKVAICAPSVYLPQLHQLLTNTAIAIGSQDVSMQEKGAFTGEVSAVMQKRIWRAICDCRSLGASPISW